LKAIVLAVVALAAIAAPAAAKPKPPSPSEAAEQFKPGQTTYDDVVAVLGRPASTTLDSTGSLIISYVSIKSHIKVASFIPVVGLFAGGAQGSTDIAVFVFGADHRLVRFSTTGSSVDCGALFTGMNCASTAPPVAPVAPTSPAAPPTSAEAPTTPVASAGPTAEPVAEPPTKATPAAAPKPAEQKKCLRIPTDPSQNDC
jgi:hypothetical protein